MFDKTQTSSRIDSHNTILMFVFLHNFFFFHHHLFRRFLYMYFSLVLFIIFFFFFLVVNQTSSKHNTLQIFSHHLASYIELHSWHTHKHTEATTIALVNLFFCIQYIIFPRRKIITYNQQNKKSSLLSLIKMRGLWR